MFSSVVIILIMLLLSGFFSGMELAFLNKNRLKLEIDRKQSRLFNFLASLFARHPSQYITTILVGNNISLVVYSLCMSQLIRAIAYVLGWTRIYTHGSILLETILPTIIIIFFAEFLPKSIVKRNPNFYYRTLSPVIYVFYIMLYPVARLTTLLSYGILRLLGRRPTHAAAAYDFDRSDLESLLDNNNGEQQHDDNDLKIFQNALDFADLRVRDSMVPRVDIEAVDIDDTTIATLTQHFVDSKYSRIFVWKDSIDNIIGYVNSKSLFHKPDNIESILMKVNYVAETLPLQNLLEQFIKSKSNVAVVIDEFGGTSGIIALEDVLEQIFGEIEDEHDVEDLTEKQIDSRTYILSCRLEVEYLNEKYDLGIEESDEYDTLAGYIIYQYDGLPKAGEELVADGLKIKILRTTRSRIELAKVERV